MQLWFCIHLRKKIKVLVKPCLEHFSVCNFGSTQLICSLKDLQSGSVKHWRVHSLQQGSPTFILSRAHLSFIVIFIHSPLPHHLHIVYYYALIFLRTRMGYYRPSSTDFWFIFGGLRKSFGMVMFVTDMYWYTSNLESTWADYGSITVRTSLPIVGIVCNSYFGPIWGNNCPKLPQPFWIMYVSFSDIYILED